MTLRIDFVVLLWKGYREIYWVPILPRMGSPAHYFFCVWKPIARGYVPPLILSMD